MENKVKNTADANDSAGATKLKVSGSRKKFYTKETVGNLITQRGIFLEVYLPALLGNNDRPTNRPNDRPTERVKEKLNFQ